MEFAPCAEVNLHREKVRLGIGIGGILMAGCAMSGMSRKVNGTAHGKAASRKTGRFSIGSGIVCAEFARGA